jgi:hypothetical protein
MPDSIDDYESNWIGNTCGLCHQKFKTQLYPSAKKRHRKTDSCINASNTQRNSDSLLVYSLLSDVVTENTEVFLFSNLL